MALSFGGLGSPTTNLITGQLTRDMRITMARWIAKSAYCIDYTGREKALRREPQDHPWKLRRDEDRLPSNVTVMLARNPFYTEFDYADSPVWPTLAGPTISRRPERTQRDIKRSYKIGFQFGHLVLVVFFWPNSDDVIALTEDHFCVWAAEHLKARIVEVEPVMPPNSGHDWFVFNLSSFIPIPPDLPGNLTIDGPPRPSCYL